MDIYEFLFDKFTRITGITRLKCHAEQALITPSMRCTHSIYSHKITERDRRLWWNNFWQWLGGLLHRSEYSVAGPGSRHSCVQEAV